MENKIPFEIPHASEVAASTMVSVLQAIVRRILAAAAQSMTCITVQVSPEYIDRVKEEFSNKGYTCRHTQKTIRYNLGLHYVDNPDELLISWSS